MKTKTKRPTVYNDNLIRDICYEFAMTPCGLDELCEEHEHWPTKETIIQWLRKNPEFAELLSEAIEIKENYVHKKVKRESLLRE